MPLVEKKNILAFNNLRGYKKTVDFTEQLDFAIVFFQKSYLPG